MTPTSWVLAIDFGTSNTAAAHRIGPDRVESLPLSHASNLMPSSVYVDGPHSMTTGDMAINQAMVDPSGFIVAPKAHVGAGTILTRGQEVPTAATIAAVMRTVYGQALQRHNNHPPSEVVLTHPEAWSPRELAVLREAASLAGLGGNISLISEPRAAAFYYSRQHDAKVVKGSTIAVFDFGGGTLDVAVLTATDEWTFEVIRAGGDNSLGGKNLDATITRWVEAQLSDDAPGLLDWLRSPEGLDTRRTLDDQIRRAKELLSEHPSATIRVAGNGSDLTLTLTRDEFEQMIEPQITHGVRLAAEVLREAGVERGKLQALYLTGGSSRIPYVHRRLSELGPIATLDDPKTVVAKGAAGFVAGGRATVPPTQVDTEVLRTRPAPPRVPSGPGAVAGPGSSASTSSPSTRTRKPLLVAGAAVAVVLAVAAGVFVATRDGGGTPAAAAASADEPPAAPDAAQPATSDSTFRSENTDDVTALLPAALVAGSSSCGKTGFSTEGALQVRCLVSRDSSLGKAIGMEQDDYESVTAWRDDQLARSKFIQLRDAKNDNVTEISSDENIIVDYDPEQQFVFFNVVDKRTGLVAHFSSDLDTGLSLLTELGWRN